MDIRKLVDELNRTIAEIDADAEPLKPDEFEQPKSFSDILNNSPFMSMNRVSQFNELLYEVTEEDDSVVVVADLPGFTDEQISLRSDERQVRVDAESTEEMRRESVSHTFRLPVDVNPEEAEATFENGVLTITLPKVEKDTHTNIDIS